MNKPTKQLIIILPICFALALLAILLYLLDPFFEPDLYRISSMIIVTLWAFFISPSLMFIVKIEKERLQNQTFEQAFKSGARIGLFLGFGGLIILCLIVSPITGTIWFIQTIKQITYSVKKINIQENQQNESDIYGI